MRIKAVRVHAYGGADQLRYEEIELSPPAAGQALIRHKAIGLNFADLHNREGRYPLPSLPHVLGGEAAGVVEAIGAGVTDVKVGAVWPMRQVVRPFRPVLMPRRGCSTPAVWWSCRTRSTISPLPAYWLRG